jgi:hypothetical protein
VGFNSSPLLGLYMSDLSSSHLMVQCYAYRPISWARQEREDLRILFFCRGTWKANKLSGTLGHYYSRPCER